MADLVNPDQLEQIVGARCHPTRHQARAVSAEQTVYILHSQECRDSTPDLRDCPFSVALDNGIDPLTFPMNIATRVVIPNGRLTPTNLDIPTTTELSR